MWNSLKGVNLTSQNACTETFTGLPRAIGWGCSKC